MFKHIPRYIQLLSATYIFNLLLLLLLRAILFFSVTLQSPEYSNLPLFDIITAFIIGMRFDNVILGYILIVPVVLLGLASFFPIKQQVIYKFVYIYLCTILPLLIVVTCVNIPFFVQYTSNLTTAVFLWADHPMYMLKLISQESSYYIYLVPLALLVLIEVKFLKRLFLKILPPVINIKGAGTYLLYGLIFLFSCGITILAIRGRVAEKTPITTSMAYFSTNPFLNNLGLSPTFTLIRSFLDDQDPKNSRISLMDSEKAISNTAIYFNNNNIDKNEYPAKREITPDTLSTKQNVVIVLMESMSKYKLGKWDGPKSLTPNLHKLIDKSFYFDRCFSAGIHTFNGIYSTLYSYPALFGQHSLRANINVDHQGLGEILKDNGYQTMYFTTQDPEFDNVQGFLQAHGFEHIHSQFDYPDEWVINTNGIPDHKLFEYAIPQLSKASDSENPFLAVLMTASDHSPYIIPEDIDFTPTPNNIKLQIAEYADWSIGQFMKAAKKTDWYNNTIFVFIADHGQSMGSLYYQQYLSFNEIPLIIYAPSLIKQPQKFDMVAGQIDVGPTVLGMLNVEYTNNTLGIDLLKEERPYMYFCADRKLGCLDEEHYLFTYENGKEMLFEYNNLNSVNYIDSFPEKVEDMRKYSHSMMQSYQWMLDNNKLVP